MQHRDLPAVVLALALAGCGGGEQSQAVATTNTATLVDDTGARDTGASIDGSAAAPSAEATVPATPATPPPAYAPDTGPAGAVTVVERYYQAIDRGNFDSAYAQWSNGGKASKQSLAQFKRGFAQTASSSVETGTPGDPEGAAGSSYITVPVTVHATLKDGTQQTFTGRYVLRRVNDVPGATAEQLAWHLYSADLKPA